MDNCIIANRTDVGRARRVNEDNMTNFDSPNGRVIAVCDGMGGQAAGDVASLLACEIIRDILENNTFDSPDKAITQAMIAANIGLLHRVSQSPELEGMGSTCVLMIVKDGMVHYGWVGDSRIYMLEDGKLKQLSKDQSYVQMLVDNGDITAEEAEHHPQKNEITNALGLEEMTPPEVRSMPVPTNPGTIFMLCSDGLSNMVAVTQIEHELKKTDASLQDKADKLVFLANNYGGRDNITVQLVEFKPQEIKQQPKAKAAAPQKEADNADDRTIVREPDKQEKIKDIKRKTGIYYIVAAICVIAICVIVYFAFFSKSDSGYVYINNILDAKCGLLAKIDALTSIPSTTI